MEEKNRNMTDERLSQELRKSKGGKLGGIALSRRYLRHDRVCRPQSVGGRSRTAATSRTVRPI